MKYTSRRKLRGSQAEFGTWLKNNALELGQIGAGAALTAIPGTQAVGIPMLASGVSGVATNAMTKPEVKDTTDPIALRRSYNINTGGSANVMMARGGNIQLDGGQLKRTASNAFVADGNTHNQGGIQLGNTEIEDDETVIQSPNDGSLQVMSDKLGYSDVANKLTKQKGELETQLAELMKQQKTVNTKRADINNDFNTEGNIVERNTHGRNFMKYNNDINNINSQIEALTQQIQEIDKQLEGLFQEQQSVNGNNQGTIAEGGAEIKDYVPYMDNVFNAVASARLSGLNTPTMRTVSTPTIDKNYNVNPQLSNIRSQTQSTGEFVKSYTNNPQVARSTMAKVHTGNIDATNQIYAQKSNVEAQKEAANLDTAAKIDYQNAIGRYQSDTAKYQSKVAGIERTSANVANAVGKFIQSESQDNLMDYQNKRARIIAEQYDGAVKLNMLANIDDVTESEYIEAIDAQMNANPKLTESFRTNAMAKWYKTRGGAPTVNTRSINFNDITPTELRYK